MPQVVLALWYRGEQVRPLAYSDGRIGDPEAADRIPGAYRRIIVGGCRPAKLAAIAQRDNDRPSSSLWHPETGGVDDARLRSIVRPPPRVDLGERSLDLRERCDRSLGKASHVLQEDGLRKEDLGKVQESVEAVGSLVVKADPRGAGPLGRLGERLARWRAGEERQRPTSQANIGGPKRLRNVEDVAGVEEWPLVVPVRLE